MSEPSIFGALKDADFWKGMGQRAKDLPSQMVNSLREFGQLPAQAADIAEQHFPGSDRDASTKNAFRHALGTGMMAQKLGGGSASALLAKLAGYGWEGINGFSGGEDMRHDLNANAIGAYVATQTRSQEELVQALKRLALQSAPVAAPGVFAPSPGYLTRSGQ
jgi:hypothetical protein